MTSPIQESFENFENLKFDTFELKDDTNDPAKKFHNVSQAVDTQYYFPSELLSLSEKLHINSENFSRFILEVLLIKAFGELA